jgi:hypothetical protein
MGTVARVTDVTTVTSDPRIDAGVYWRLCLSNFDPSSALYYSDPTSSRHPVSFSYRRALRASSCRVTRRRGYVLNSVTQQEVDSIWNRRTRCWGFCGPGMAIGTYNYAWFRYMHVPDRTNRSADQCTGGLKLQFGSRLIISATT